MKGCIIKGREIKFPVFMPIATKGAVKSLSPDDLNSIGASVVLGNTYHLWLRPGDKLIKKAGGLHRFMQWPGPILTDSGGFQVFSLGARAKDRFGKSGVELTEKGVYFSDPVDGSKHFLSPEKSIDIQLNLDSDIVMVLDECPPYPCSHDYARRSMELTLRWAERSKKHFEKRMIGVPSHKRPWLFPIVQGSLYRDLREECARRLVEMDFDGYAIGGVAVGEPREKLKDILDWTVPLLPASKPRYLMGLGRPEELVRAVRAGIDMFDCVIPTREGRHGRLFVRKDSDFKKISEKKSSYATINIGNRMFEKSLLPIDKHCQCYACRNFSRAYLRHLLATQEPLFLRLASLHNLTFYLELMKRLG